MNQLGDSFGGNRWILFGTIIAFFSVALGAFGAHGLRDKLSEKAMATFQLATQYQFTHALALILLGLWSLQFPQANTTISGWSFTLGCVLFSGSLYVLSITGIGFFGAITPLGGLGFLIGWASFAASVIQRMR